MSCRFTHMGKTVSIFYLVYFTSSWTLDVNVGRILGQKAYFWEKCNVYLYLKYISREGKY